MGGVYLDSQPRANAFLKARDGKSSQVALELLRARIFVISSSSSVFHARAAVARSCPLLLDDDARRRGRDLHADLRCAIQDARRRKPARPGTHRDEHVFMHVFSIGRDAPYGVWTVGWRVAHRRDRSAVDSAIPVRAYGNSRARPATSACFANPDRQRSAPSTSSNVPGATRSSSASFVRIHCGGVSALLDATGDITRRELSLRSKR